MAIDQPITDRDAFGHWLSGFSDGESCFSLYFMKYPNQDIRPVVTCKFRITLREDDEPILKQIRDFLGVGTFYYREKSPYSRNVQVTYCVHGMHDLVRVIIPNFETYPLRAKKRRDFELWKQGVHIAYGPKMRQRQRICGHKWHKPWTENEIAEFRLVSDALRQQRAIESSPLRLPVTQSAPELCQQLLPWEG